MEFSVTCPEDKINPKLPSDHFTLEIRNIICEKEHEVQGIISLKVQRICQALTLMILSSNYNYGVFQPRVIPDYNNAKYRREPMIDDSEYPVQIIQDKEGNRTIHLTINEGAYESMDMHLTVFGRMYTCLFWKFYNEPKSLGK